MAIKYKVFLILAAILVCSGCGPIPIGVIYSDVVRPLDTNMENTKRGGERVSGKLYTIREPVTAVRVGAQWNSKAIGDVAKNKGLEKVHFADLRTESILFDLWKRETLYVWGE